MALTRTLAILKPDTIQKRNAGSILQMILDAGFEIKAIKLIRLAQRQAEKFYSVHREKPFFSSLVEFMCSGPVLILVPEKENAVDSFRELIGSTDPSQAAEGTIRKLFAENVERNAIHGSDSEENSEKEIFFFFEEDEILE